MREIRLKARAKINLTLDVTGKREDGYHLLETIMQTVALYDGIYMKKLEKPVIKLKTNLPWLPTDARNLAWKAANLMRETFGIKEGVFIEIDKRIPVAAGLAGGSTDCAAVLVGMNRLFGLGLSEAQLEEGGGQIGFGYPLLHPSRHSFVRGSRRGDDKCRTSLSGLLCGIGKAARQRFHSFCL